MRFNDDHWRDKTYRIIREELSTAGYRVLRADEVRSSGPVVDEVCRLLREAELVVIDSSGDSQSVSYEVGYCHGIDRDPRSTLLIRDNAILPFNYRHYRHRIYRDFRHLRRLIRDYLDLTEPPTNDMYGYAFSFSFSEEASYGYIMDGAECVLDALLSKQPTGRCELFGKEHFELPGRLFTIGVLLRQRSKTLTPSYKFWVGMLPDVVASTRRFDGRITFQDDLSELGMYGVMQQTMMPCGVAELRSGEVFRILAVAEDEAFFDHYLLRKDEAMEHADK